jgi:hypothetical protein
MQTLQSLKIRLEEIEFVNINKLFDLKIVTLELTNYLMSEYIINRQDPTGRVKDLVAELVDIYGELHELKKYKDEITEGRFDIYRQQITNCIELAIKESEAGTTKF